LKTKEDILENDGGNQTVIAIDFHTVFLFYLPTMEVNECHQLFGYQPSAFVFNRRQKVTQVWNHLRASKGAIPLN